MCLSRSGSSAAFSAPNWENFGLTESALEPWAKTKIDPTKPGERIAWQILRDPTSDVQRTVASLKRIRKLLRTSKSKVPLYRETSSLWKSLIWGHSTTLPPPPHNNVSLQDLALVTCNGKIWVPVAMANDLCSETLQLFHWKWRPK